ncbi:MAG: J domain-containing protein [Myxococcales bacterium]
MTFDEALSLLGIERTTDAATARRAYLRLLKQHPPERDPESFKRLRAAYETVQPRLRSGPAPEVVGSSLALAMEMPTPPEASEAPVTLEEPLANPPPSLSERYWSESDPAVQESIAREAVAREQSEEAYSLLLASLEERDAENEQLLVARQAVRRGHREFLLRIGDQWPDQLTDAELTSLREISEGKPEWARMASILLERGNAKAAAQLALSELAREKGDPLSPRAPMWWVTRVVTGLLGSSEVALALQVFGAVSARTDIGEAGIDGARLTLLRELVAVRPELPDAFARVLAKAIDSGEMERAESQLLDLVDQSDKATRKEVTRLLKRQAPTLFSYYEKGLRGTHDSVREPWYRGSWGGPTWGMLVLINFLRLTCNHCVNDTAKPKFDEHAVLEKDTPQKAFCEEQGALCDEALRWSRAEECDEMRAAFSALAREYELASKYSQPSLNQRLGFALALKETNGRCPMSISVGGSSR